MEKKVCQKMKQKTYRETKEGTQKKAEDFAIVTSSHCLSTFSKNTEMDMKELRGALTYMKRKPIYLKGMF